MTLEQIQSLTDDEIRVRVAELCGWQVKATRGKYDLVIIDPHGFEVAWGNLRGRTPDELRLAFSHNLPNYPADLNACATFERDLAAIYDYRDTLAEICVDSWKDGNHWIPFPEFATARQRCNAFLATMGKEAT